MTQVWTTETTAETMRTQIRSANVMVRFIKAGEVEKVEYRIDIPGNRALIYTGTMKSEQAVVEVTVLANLLLDHLGLP